MTDRSMTTAAALPEPSAAPPPRATRPLYWSIRREIWENPSFYVAPLFVAGLVLVGCVISLSYLPHIVPLVASQTPEKRMAALSSPYAFAAISIAITSFIVGAFYCLGALHGERRDRTILFWKSLPISDLTAVLAKAAIPLAILPVITFVVTVVLMLIVLGLNAVGLAVNGFSTAPLVTELPLFNMILVLAYGLVVLALWHAPIYAYLLLVSAWARRTTFLWAVLPPIALGLVERIAFDTHYVGALIRYRLFGGFAEAFHVKSARAAFSHDLLSQIDPAGFLMTPGLWLGLIAAGAFLAAAVWLRRYREPI
ncbi:MAG: hypothetical protein ACHP7N_04470 [Caulobacterales bacterium]